MFHENFSQFFFFFKIASRSFDPLTQNQYENVLLYWWNETHHRFSVEFLVSMNI